MKVVYDPAEVGLPLLLGLYFKTIDPTSLNKQGNDRGTQYRTGIYYTDPADREVIVRAVDELSKRYDRPLAIEVKPLDNFYPAEGYHQDYLDKNPGGYCHIDPALFGLARQANLRPAGEGMKPPHRPDGLPPSGRCDPEKNIIPRTICRYPEKCHGTTLSKCLLERIPGRDLCRYHNG